MLCLGHGPSSRDLHLSRFQQITVSGSDHKFVRGPRCRLTLLALLGSVGPGRDEAETADVTPGGLPAAAPAGRCPSAVPAPAPRRSPPGAAPPRPRARSPGPG